MAVEPGLSNQSKRVIELRHSFLKQVQNPYRHMENAGGHVFDPAFYRFQAMRATQWDHFKPNIKTARFGILSVVVPIVFFTWLVKNDRDKKEHMYRTGQVAYKDRRFKFV